MSDTDKNSGFPEAEHTKEETSIKNNADYNQSEDDSTYWESGNWQSSYDSTKSQSNDNPNNQTRLLQKKGSIKRPIIATLIIVALLLATTATVYAFNSNLRNSIDLLRQSPREYYASIESKSIEGSVDKSMAYMNMNNSRANMALDVSANISYDKDTVGALLKGSMGMSISDLEALLGIPLDSIGLDMIVANNEREVYDKIGLKMNNVDIIFAELFMDYASKEMLMHLPDLSAAYLRQSLDVPEMDGFNFNNLQDITNYLSSDSAGKFIKRYTKMLIDEVKDVELTKGEQLKVGDLTVDVNLLSVSLYPETIYNMVTKALEEAKNDEYILGLLPHLNISKDEYKQKVDEGLSKIKQEFDDLDDKGEPFVMSVYVGMDGNIIGRRFEHEDSSLDAPAIGYFNLTVKDKGAYEFYISNDGDKIINVSGEHRINNKAYTGVATIEIALEDGSQNTSFDIEYQDIKTVLKDNILYNYGSINLSSYAMMGMEIAMDFDVKDEEQLATIKLMMGRSSLVTLETSTKHLNDFTIPKPDDNAEYYDLITESQAYFSTIDLQDFISKLSDRLGINLEGLFGSFLPFY